MYNDSVEKAIFCHLQPEMLDGDNAYACPKCDKKVRAAKGTHLSKLPRILTL